MLVALAVANQQAAAGEVAVGQVEGAQLGAADAGVEEEEHHGGIAPPGGGGGIARRHQARELGGGEGLYDRGGEADVAQAAEGRVLEEARGHAPVEEAAHLAEVAMAGGGPAGLKGLAVADHGRGLDGRGLIGHALRGDAALEPGQGLAVGTLGAWREALDPAAGEIEGDQLREGGGGGHGDMDARGRTGVKSRGRLATRRGASEDHYAAATALAAQIPGTTVTGGDGVAVHAVPLDGESLAALGALLELVVGWKRTALWRGGQRLPAGTLTHLACWRERETSGLGGLHCQGWGDGGRSAVPRRLLARALRYDWGSDVPADAVGARLIQGLAQRDCVTACPADDAPTVVAGLRAHLRDCRREADWPLADAAEDDWLARLLIDVDLGDES